MIVFICTNSLEGILTGVYEAWASQDVPHEDKKLVLKDCWEPELFADYREVAVQEEKAAKVIRSIRRKLSPMVYERVYEATLSGDPERADAVYRFLIDGFRYGDRILEMLALPSVIKLFELCRYVLNENHLLTGFVRFSKTDTGLLISKIHPENDVVTLLAIHFANRLPSENWMIYDSGREKAAIHPAGGEWFLLNPGDGDWAKRVNWKTDEEEYQSLWSVFCQSVAIKERRNEVCQRNHLPLRYRPYMTEFHQETPFSAK